MDLICRALSWNISIKNVSYSFLYFVSRNPEIMLPNNLNGVEYPAILKTYLILFLCYILQRQYDPNNDHLGPLSLNWTYFCFNSLVSKPKNIYNFILETTSNTDPRIRNMFLHVWSVNGSLNVYLLQCISDRREWTLSQQ